MPGAIRGKNGAASPGKAAICHRNRTEFGRGHHFVAGFTENLALFEVPGGESLLEVLGSPSAGYANAVVDCLPGEALIVELNVPDCAYWGIQLGDVWSKPLDSMFNQTEINMNRAVIDADGKFRCVISHHDTGIHNWLEIVGGRTEFVIVVRIFREVGDMVCSPTLKTVKLSELREHLPEDTATVTPAQRRNHIERRRLGNVQLYDAVRSVQVN